jgi:hypothetical protein
MLVVWINVAARGLDINDVRLYFGRFIMNPASTNVAALNRSICTLVASVQCTEASRTSGHEQSTDASVQCHSDKEASAQIQSSKNPARIILPLSQPKLW